MCWIAKKPTVYIITKFSFFIAPFLIIFLSQKWHFIERFINHTYFNLILSTFLREAPKKKTILTASLGTEPKAYEHFN